MERALRLELSECLERAISTRRQVLEPDHVKDIIALIKQRKWVLEETLDYLWSKISSLKRSIPILSTKKHPQQISLAYTKYLLSWKLLDHLFRHSHLVREFILECSNMNTICDIIPYLQTLQTKLKSENKYARILAGTMASSLMAWHKKMSFHKPLTLAIASLKKRNVTFHIVSSSEGPSSNPPLSSRQHLNYLRTLFHRCRLVLNDSESILRSEKYSVLDLDRELLAKFNPLYSAENSGNLDTEGPIFPSGSGDEADHNEYEDIVFEDTCTDQITGGQLETDNSSTADVKFQIDELTSKTNGLLRELNTVSCHELTPSIQKAQALSFSSRLEAASAVMNSIRLQCLDETDPHRKNLDINISFDRPS
ncbi:uncharacterized protein LOC126326238 [Schistocerca gregaria]|uniref:uncharacterized protein LOC126326238 n=1 Tax=Schistocerca gregaria TaxID=7010 RepID=UPI00211E7383|nr:uncharacterized protein LOC126326238 [Schistocerca gregaria]